MEEKATHQTLLLLGVPFAHVDDSLTSYDLELTDHDSSSDMPAFIILTLQYKDTGIPQYVPGSGTNDLFWNISCVQKDNIYSYWGGTQKR